MQCAISRVRLLGFLALAVLMFGACYICAFLHGGLIPTVAGWFGFVFIGCVAVKSIVVMLRPGIRVIVDDDGIEDRRLRIGVVPWEEITAIELCWTGPAKYLCVEVLDPDKYLARMPLHVRLATRANALLGYPPITMTFAGLSPGISEVWEYIQTHHPPPGRARSAQRGGTGAGHD